MEESAAGDTLCLRLGKGARAGEIARRGRGNGPIAATVAALNPLLRVDSYEQRSLGGGAQARSMSIVEVAHPEVAGSRFGVGLHESIATASVLAVLGAFNRLGRTLD